MKCKKCNTENKDENKFCAECGEQLKSIESIKTKLCHSCGKCTDPLDVCTCITAAKGARIY